MIWPVIYRQVSLKINGINRAFLKQKITKVNFNKYFYTFHKTTWNSHWKFTPSVFFDCIKQITLCQGYKHLDVKFFYCLRNRLPHVTTENKTHALTNTFKHYRRSTLRRCEAVHIYINLTKIISLSMLPKHDLKTPMGYHK